MRSALFLTLITLGSAWSMPVLAEQGAVPRADWVVIRDEARPEQGIVDLARSEVNPDQPIDAHVAAEVPVRPGNAEAAEITVVPQSVCEALLYRL